MARPLRNAASEFFTITNAPVRIEAPKENLVIPAAPVLDKKIARLNAKVQSSLTRLRNAE